MVNFYKANDNQKTTNKVSYNLSVSAPGNKDVANVRSKNFYINNSGLRELKSSAINFNKGYDLRDTNGTFEIMSPYINTSINEGFYAPYLKFSENNRFVNALSSDSFYTSNTGEFIDYSPNTIDDIISDNKINFFPVVERKTKKQNILHYNKFTPLEFQELSQEEIDFLLFQTEEDLQETLSIQSEEKINTLQDIPSGVEISFYAAPTPDDCGYCAKKGWWWQAQVNWPCTTYYAACTSDSNYAGSFVTEDAQPGDATLIDNTPYYSEEEVLAAYTPPSDEQTTPTPSEYFCGPGLFILFIVEYGPVYPAPQGFDLIDNGSGVCSIEADGFIACTNSGVIPNPPQILLTPLDGLNGESVYDQNGWNPILKKESEPLLTEEECLSQAVNGCYEWIPSSADIYSTGSLPSGWAICSEQFYLIGE